MAKNDITIRDVYDIMARVEDKMDERFNKADDKFEKMDSRIMILEDFKSKWMGTISVIVVFISTLIQIGISFINNKFKG